MVPYRVQTRIVGSLVVCLLIWAGSLIAAETPSTTDGVNNTRAADVQNRQLDVEKLRLRIDVQHQQIETLRKQIDVMQNALLDQQRLLEAASLQQSGVAIAPQPVSAPLAEAASRTLVPLSASSGTAQAVAKQDDLSSPLQLRLGSATVLPFGWMDLINATRSATNGNGVGTNFGNIPYSNIANGLGRLSENRFSAQNSRMGVRVDTNYKGAKVLGFLETDFFGNAAASLPVTANSATLRLRLGFADIRVGRWEIAGGQMWSAATMGRKGISSLPSDVFISNDVDANYQLGLAWARQPGFRVLYHAAKEQVTMGLSIEQSEQYIGGGCGGTAVVLPAAFAAAYSAQLDNNGTSLGAPNLHPDLIAKIALDPNMPAGHSLHFELMGMERTFKTYDPTANRSHTVLGGAGSASLLFELFPGFRLVSTNYYGDGGGRYILGLSPDLIAKANGSLSLIHSGAVVEGFEATIRKTLVYGYYGGVYVQRNIAVDINGKLVGYGYTGSSNGMNRTIQEITFGFNRTLWKDPKFGALNFLGQYSYLQRNPWYVAAGTPKDAHLNMMLFDLRYTLPGAPPASK
jgi:hypothetical protein